MEWILAHGAQAVVTTSQLQSRGSAAPVRIDGVHRAFATPAPVLPSDREATEFSISYTAAEDSHLEDVDVPSDGEDSEEDDDDNIPDDPHGQFAFEVPPVFSVPVLKVLLSDTFVQGPDPMEGLEFHGPNVNEVDILTFFQLLYLHH